MKTNSMQSRPLNYISFFATVTICILVLLPSTPAHAATKKQVSYNGITFTYDASLASSVTAETIPEQIGDPTGGGWWFTHPQHVKFTFHNFAATTPGWEPTIYIYPIKSSYAYLTPAGNHDLWLDTMDATRSLVSQKRHLDPYRYADAAIPPGGSIESIPFLPLINAATAFVGKQQFLDFQDGSGFRCFTTIAQFPAPVTGEYTLYTFQGVSNDGKYYVAAVFPAFLSNPPAASPVQGSGIDEAASKRSAIKAIEESTNDQFTPNLNQLDATIASLTTPTSNLPATGIPNSNLDALALLAALTTLAAGLLARRSTEPYAPRPKENNHLNKQNPL